MMKNRLRVLRAERDGISQRDTALKAGIALDRYWRIENGYADPTDDEIKKLARVFRGATPEDLFPELKSVKAS